MQRSRIGDGGGHSNNLHRREKQEKNNTNTDNNSSVGSNMIICSYGQYVNNRYIHTYRVLLLLFIIMRSKLVYNNKTNNNIL